MTKTNRNFKKVMVCLMAVVFAIGTAAVPAITKKSIVNASSKPVIEEVEYKGNGKVEVDFYGKVQYKNPKVVVKGNGKSYKAKNYCWDDFVKGIKHKNRFHSDYINTDKLFIFLRCAVKPHHKGEVMFRSRICPDEKGFEREVMGAPDNKAKGGRVNPTGISILYLADSIETTLYEIRAGVYDLVSVGQFELLRDIKVINLANIDCISPFIGIDYGFDFTQYAMNIEHLRMIAQEIAKPLRNGNVLDYLPTQYISDFIRSKGYDGILYIYFSSKLNINVSYFFMIMLLMFFSKYIQWRNSKK